MEYKLENLAERDDYKVRVTDEQMKCLQGIVRPQLQNDLYENMCAQQELLMELEEF